MTDPALGSAFDRRPAVSPARARRWDRRDLAVLGAAALGGIAFGLMLHYADSLAPDQVWMGVVGKVLFALVLLFAAAAGAMQYAAGAPQTLTTVAVLLVATVAAYPFGPAVAPGIGVPGSFTIALDGEPGPAQGGATCDWAPGRARMSRIGGDVRLTSGAAALSVDLFGARVEIKGASTWVRFGPDALAPAHDAPGAGAGNDASGTIGLDLLRIEGSAGPDELTGTLSWECQAPPPG